MPVDYGAILPEIILTTVALAVLVLDWVLPPRSKPVLGALSIVGILCALIALIPIGGETSTTLAGMFRVDSFAVMFKALFLVSGALVLLISLHYIQDGPYAQGEFYFLLLSSILGMMIIASARDLITIFIALELVSAPSFILAGLRKWDVKSNEAALKFFLIGVLSVAVMLFGMSLIYGIAGTTNLAGIARRIGDSGDVAGILGIPSAAAKSVLLASALLIIVGFGFKISAAPFHFWVPDTYEGSPVPVAAFLSVASKTAGFVGLFLIVFLAFPSLSEELGPIFGLLAAMTMTIGNLVALSQRHIIRLLAYSSVAQAGYILLPLAFVRPGSARNSEALSAAIVYLLIYAFMEIGVFTVALTYGRRGGGGGFMISDYAGLWRRAPALAVFMTVFLLSLAGMPPFAGWFAKFVVFSVAIDANAGWLAAIMAVNTVIALFYYANVVRYMFFQPPPEGLGEVEVPWAPRLAVAITAAVTFVVGILPDLFDSLARVSTFV